MLYKSLDLYTKIVSEVKVWAWWRYTQQFPQDAYKVRALCRLMLSQSCLNETRSRYTDTSSLCERCQVAETVTHLLFECKLFNDLRDVLWQRVTVAAPAAMQHEFRRMSNKQKTVFVMSALHGDYITEWQELYFEMLEFCFCIYSARHDMVDV